MLMSVFSVFLELSFPVSGYSVIAYTGAWVTTPFICVTTMTKLITERKIFTHFGFDSKQARNELPAAPSGPHCLAGVLADRVSLTPLLLRLTRPTTVAAQSPDPVTTRLRVQDRVQRKCRFSNTYTGHSKCLLKAALISRYEGQEGMEFVTCWHAVTGTKWTKMDVHGPLRMTANSFADLSSFSICATNWLKSFTLSWSPEDDFQHQQQLSLNINISIKKGKISIHTQEIQVCKEWYRLVKFIDLIHEVV